MESFHWIVILVVFAGTLSTSWSQQAPANCSSVYRSIQRHGQFILGQLKIPVATREDSLDQGFKLQLSLNRAVRSVHVRQAKAREMGTSHTSFMIDASPKDGTIKMDTAIRMRPSGFRIHVPRVVRVIYNGRALCGPSLTQSEEDESVTVTAIRIKSSTKRSTTTTTTPVPADQRDDDDYYF